MHELIGKEVEVEAMGITYTGTLVEVGEAEVHLQTDSGWVVVPLEQVVNIRAKEA